MGCPVHIWIPMAAAIAPAATMAKHKLLSVLPTRTPDTNPADQIDTMTRWSPIAQTTPDAK